MLARHANLTETSFLCRGGPRYFGLQLSRFRPVLIYDMHGRKFHRPCSGLYACPNHTDDDIHLDHGYLDTLDNPLGPS